MAQLRLFSAAEQVATHLRGEILRGRWTSTLPGVYQLAKFLGVNHKTIGAAFILLEREGLLVGQGAGRSRQIVLPSGTDAVRPMRVGLFLHDTNEDKKTEFVIELRHALTEAGHVALFPRKTLQELKMNVKRIAGAVRSSDVDAWVVYVGTRQVLQWFSAQPEPAFALAGRQEGVDIAGTKPNMPEAYASATRRLLELGHRRIVLLCRAVRRLPEPGRTERAFLETLEADGIQTSKYNLPDWEDSPEGLRAVLDSLFQVTPPTALFVDEPLLYAAARQALQSRGVRIPDDVSLVCTSNDPSFAWCRPTVAHMDYDTGLVVRRMVRWVANVSRGRQDTKQTMVPASFAEGGSIGPAPSGGARRRPRR